MLGVQTEGQRFLWSHSVSTSLFALCPSAGTGSETLTCISRGLCQGAVQLLYNGQEYIELKIELNSESDL